MKNLRIVVVAAVSVVAGVLAGVAGTLLVSRVRSAAPRAEVARPEPAPAARAPTPAPRPSQASPDPKAVYRVPLDDSPVRGGKAALVTIVVSSDFECPFCKRVEPTLKQIADAYGEKVRFVFKENPLGMHANALPAAKLAEEARAQGGDARFWEVHDRLFQLPSLDRPALEKVAREVGLAAPGVQAALDTPRHVDRIRRDQNLVNSLGAGGTPTLFVNGRKVVGAQPFEAFKAVIDEELARAQALVESGVAPADVYARTIEKGATAPPAVQGAAAEVARVPLRPDDPVRGPRVAPVTIVLFSDFQCPFCARVEPTLRQLREEYGDKIRIAWKHQPLPFHPNALPAARAAEAARVAGKFWEMHDRLFSSQQALSDATYLQYAKELKLDAARFQRDAAADGTARRIAEDQQLASAVGATGTPTLFVNCRKTVGAKPLAELERIVDEELARARQMEARGEKADADFYEKICSANVARLAAR